MHSGDKCRQMPYNEINLFNNNEKNGRKNGKQKPTH